MNPQQAWKAKLEGALFWVFIIVKRQCGLFSTWFFASSLISNKTNCPTYLVTYLDYFFQRLPYPLKYKKKNGPVSKTFDFQSLFCNLLSCPYKVKDKNTRVDMVETNHNELLTQCRHIPMGQFGANIFLIRTTSNYLWTSEVFKNQSFKSQLFSSSHSPKQLMNYEILVVFQCEN